VSKYLKGFWSDSKAQLVELLLNDEQFQLTELETSLVKHCLDFTTAIRRFKECHYGCVALFAQGEIELGAQIYCRKLHEANRCAESLPLALAQKSILVDKPNHISTFIVHHANFDRYGKVLGSPTLAAPCGNCLRLAEQVSPDVLVVTDLDGRFGEGRLVKAPIEVLWQYFAHARKHNGETKHHGEAIEAVA
jgi:hypothetical protein